MKKPVRVVLSIAAAVLSGVGAIFIASPEKRHLDDAVRAATGFDYVVLSEGVTECEISGPADGTPVILVHGMSVPMFDWDNQAAFLADRGFRVIRYNQYGRAYSDRPRGAYDRGRYVRQLDDLMEALGIDRAHLVVHSMGAAVAVSFANVHPEKIDRTVLIAPVLYMAEDHGGIAAVRVPVFGDVLAKTVLPGMLADRADGLFREAGIPEADAYSEAFRDQIRYAGFSRSVKSLFRKDMVEDLSDAYRGLDGGTTLMIRGTQDDSVPEEHFAAIQDLLPTMQIAVVGGAGHSPNFERPDEVNALIAEFLSGL